MVMRPLNKRPVKVVRPLGGDHNRRKYVLNADDWIVIGKWLSQKAFESGDEPIDVIIAFRVVYKKFITDKDRFGGYIQYYSNLDQYGECRVDNGSIVIENALVAGDAQVGGSVLLYGDSYIGGTYKKYNPDSNFWVSEFNYLNQIEKKPNTPFYSLKDANRCYIPVDDQLTKALKNGGVKINQEETDKRNHSTEVDDESNLSPIQQALIKWQKDNVVQDDPQPVQKINSPKQKILEKVKEKKPPINTIQSEDNSDKNSSEAIIKDDLDSLLDSNPVDERRALIQQLNSGYVVGGYTPTVACPKIRQLTPRKIYPRTFGTQIEQSLRLQEQKAADELKKQHTLIEQEDDVKIVSATITEESSSTDIDLSKIPIDILLPFETIGNAIFDEEHKKYVLLQDPFFEQQIGIYRNAQMISDVTVHRILYSSGLIGGYVDTYNVLSQDDDCYILDTACAVLGTKLSGQITLSNWVKVINSKISSSQAVRISGSLQIYDSSITALRDIHHMRRFIIQGKLSHTFTNIAPFNRKGQVNEELYDYSVGKLLRNPRGFCGYSDQLGLNFTKSKNIITDIQHPILGQITIDLINKINLFLKQRTNQVQQTLVEHQPIQVVSQPVVENAIKAFDQPEKQKSSADIDLSNIPIETIEPFETVDNAIFDDEHPKYVLLKNEFFTQRVIVEHHNQQVAEAIVHRILYSSGDLGGYIDSYDVLSQKDSCRVDRFACAALGSRLRGSIILSDSAKVINSKISSQNLSEVIIRRERQIHDSEHCFTESVSTVTKTMFRGIWSPPRYNSTGKADKTYLEFPSAKYILNSRRHLYGYTANLRIRNNDCNPSISRFIHPILGPITIDLINKINLFLKKVRSQQTTNDDKKSNENSVQDIPIVEKPIEALDESSPISTIFPSTKSFTLDPYASIKIRFDERERTVYRIKYNDGTNGGYVESPSNLEGTGIISENAMVYGDVVISGDTIVTGNAVIGGTGRLSWPMTFDHGHIIVTGDNLFNLNRLS